MAEKLRLQEQRDAPGPAWEFVHPRCARKRRDDIEEVEDMVAAGEAEIARDELVWLLSECPDFLEAHLHLGLIALEDDDPKLARGHFGRAYELGLRALEAAGSPRPLPYALVGNKPFFEAAKGLVHCLVATGKLTVAEDVVRRTTTLDPTDPLALAALVAAARSQPRRAKRKERP
jgi:tetratricopeptide (TPR) repeat protein